MTLALIAMSTLDAQWLAYVVFALLLVALAGIGVLWWGRRGLLLMAAFLAIAALIGFLRERAF